MYRLQIFAALCFFCSSVSADELVPFRAQYSANYIGMPARAKGTRELVVTDKGHYRLTSSAKSMLIKVNESSEFIMESGQIKPLRYNYSRSGIGKNKKEQMLFDWGTNTVSHNGVESAITPGLLDKLSYQHQISLDLTAEKDPGIQRFDYMIADKAKRKEYSFKVTGREILNTAAGDLDTLRLERIRNNSDRKTTFWLAVEHNYLLVRMEQLEDGKGVVLDLKKFESGIN